MTDLQCPATAVVIAGDDPTDVEHLRAMVPAAVLAWPGHGDAAARLAAVLDVVRVDLPGAGATADALIASLDGLADEYRGECLAVVVPPRVLAALTDRVLPAGGHRRVVVELDADGRRWAPWPTPARR